MVMRGKVLPSNNNYSLAAAVVTRVTRKYSDNKGDVKRRKTLVEVAQTFNLSYMAASSQNLLQLAVKTHVSFKSVQCLGAED